MLRTHNRLNKLSLELAESIFEKIHIYYLVNRIEVKDFLELMIEQLEMVKSLGVPVLQSEHFIIERVNYLALLDREYKVMTEKNILTRVHETTVHDLEEFQQLRPIHEKLWYFEKEIVKKDKIIVD